MWYSEQVKVLNHKWDIWNCVSHPKLKTWSQNCNVPDFYKSLHSEEIEHANKGVNNVSLC